MKLFNSVLVLSLLGLTIPSLAVAAEVVHIERPWIQEGPPGVKVMAGYVLLSNVADESVALVGAKSADFDRIEVHRTEFRDGMARMIHQKRVELAPGESVTFEPGGHHLMFMRPRRALSHGDEVEVTLMFDGSVSRTVTFPVMKSSAAADEHFGH